MTRRAAYICQTTHLKQVSSFTLGKKQNDFCQVKFNKSGYKININAYGGSMVIRFTTHSTIKSPWIHHYTFNSYSYTLLHIATSSLHAITDVFHRNLLLFNAATHRYILLRNFDKKRCCLGFVWGPLSFAGDFCKVVEDAAEV